MKSDIPGHSNISASQLTNDLQAEDDSTSFDGQPLNAETAKAKLPSTVELQMALGIPAKARSRRVWTAEEDERLRLLVSYWGDQCGKNGKWDQISSHFDNRSNKDCRKRWFHSLDPKLKRGRWKEHEDKVLIEAHKKMGPVWHKIAQLIPGRTDDQCSKRYNDVLDPRIQNRLRQWTTEEDKLLLDLVKKYGTQWRSIAQKMDGRTGLTCRNRWRKIVSSAVKHDGNPPPESFVDNANAAPDNLAIDDYIPDAQPMEIESDDVGDDSSSVYSNAAQTAQEHQSRQQSQSQNLPQNPLSQQNPPLQLAQHQPELASQRPPQLQYDPSNRNNANNTTTNYSYSLEIVSNNPEYGLQNDGMHRTLSHSDIVALLDVANERNQKIVIHQHNYHHHHTIVRNSDDSEEELSEKTTAPPSASGISSVAPGSSISTPSHPTVLQQHQYSLQPARLSSIAQFQSSQQQSRSSSAPTEEIASMSFNENNVATPGSLNFVELELMDMGDDPFGPLSGEDLSFGFNVLEGIPFNPS